MIKPSFKENGYILVWLILSMVAATILASVLYNSVYQSNAIFMRYYNVKRAYYASAAGVEYARFIIKNPAAYNNPTIPGGPPPWPRGQSFPPFSAIGDNISTVYVEITQPGGAGSDYTIKSTGTVPGQSKTITATSTTTGLIEKWE